MSMIQGEFSYFTHKCSIN